MHSIKGPLGLAILILVHIALGQQQQPTYNQRSPPPVSLYDRYAPLTEDDVYDDDDADATDYSDTDTDAQIEADSVGSVLNYVGKKISFWAKTSRMLSAILRRGKRLFDRIPLLATATGRAFVEQLPTTREILNYGKQTLLGVPQEVIAYAFNTFCTTAVGQEHVRPRSMPALHQLQYVLITGDEAAEVQVPLQSPQLLWQHPLFRRDWPVVVVITGWNSNVNQSNGALEVLHEAYRCRGRHNFVAIDLERYVDTLYMWSAVNTRPLGRRVGEALAMLTRMVRPENVHVIGHSLGAHISGEAGRTYTLITGQKLPRITGLDPAQPCFNEGEHLNGLQRGDAHFVDVIHTNAGILGQRLPSGDADFYPNGHDPLQPGCWTIFCSHSRAYEYFAESVYPGNGHNFMATKCHKLGAYKRGHCAGETVPMGFRAMDFANGTGIMPSGSFILVTAKESPFGKTPGKPTACHVTDASDRIVMERNEMSSDTLQVLGPAETFSET